MWVEMCHMLTWVCVFHRFGSVRRQRGQPIKEGRAPMALCSSLHLWGVLLILIKMSPCIFYLLSIPFSLLAYRAPHLVVFCDSGIELYDADHAKWMQTIPIRKVCVCVCVWCVCVRVCACECMPTVANWLCALALMPLFFYYSCIQSRRMEA